MWGLYIPDLAIIYCPEHILCFQLPDFSALSPSDQVVMETPMWYLPVRCAVTRAARGARTQFVEPVCDPSVTNCFNLYLIHTADSWNTMRIISGTIIPPTTPLPPVSSQAHLVPNLLPWEMRVRTQSLPSISPHHKRRELPGESNRDGFHPPIHRAERGSELCVGSYEGMMRGGESETLSVFIPEEEMGTIDSDLFVSMIDEASGRVLI